MILLIDNYDSFTFNLAHYIEETGQSVSVLRNDKVSICLLYTSDAADE